MKKMKKRMVALYCVLFSLLGLLLFRTFRLVDNEDLAASAKRQSTYTVPLATLRGNIYDCNGKKLVNTTQVYMAVVMPNVAAASQLAPYVAEDQKEELQKKLKGNKPFAIQVTQKEIPGVQVFAVPRRYSAQQSLAHVIGYIDGDGKGVTGIEKAYNDLLSESSAAMKVTFRVDALGRVLSGDDLQLVDETSTSKTGVQLTIDSEIQQIAEEAVKGRLDKGAVVVMESETGKIRASVSMPDFDPDNVAAYLNEADAPLLNKAFLAYNVGSTYKLAVAATALEEGLPPEAYQYTCTGKIEISGHTFTCLERSGHGTIGLDTAIARSCNTYFINLGQQLSFDAIRRMSLSMGFGKGYELAPGLTTASGYYPISSDIHSPADLANLSFGQGKLMGTPVQLALMVSSIATGGRTPTPILVEGTIGAGGALTQTAEENLTRVMSEKTAQTLQQYMVGVIENGLGSLAKPEHLTAGGKTATAQTGVFQDGKEEIRVWFCGFYPAEKPKYTIVVLSEDGEAKATPVFKEIADGLYRLKKVA